MRSTQHIAQALASGYLLARVRKSLRTCAQQKASNTSKSRASFLYALYRSHTTIICTKSLEKYASGTCAPRPGAITYTIAEAERMTHKYHRWPTLPGIDSNTFQPVSSA